MAKTTNTTDDKVSDKKPSVQRVDVVVRVPSVALSSKKEGD